MRYSIYDMQYALNNNVSDIKCQNMCDMHPMIYALKVKMHKIYTAILTAVMAYCISKRVRGGRYGDIHPLRTEKFSSGGDFAPLCSQGEKSLPKRKKSRSSKTSLLLAMCGYIINYIL